MVNRPIVFLLSVLIFISLVAPLSSAAWPYSLHDNLRAYWTYNETSGSKIDSLGLYNITLTGGTLSTPDGLINASWVGDVSGNDGTVDASLFTGIGGKWTYSVWFYSSAWASARYLLWTSDSGSGLIIAENNAPQTADDMTVYFNGQTTSLGVTTATSSWHHLVVTADNSTGRLITYWDGVLKTNISSGTFNTISAPTTPNIGGHDAGTGYSLTQNMRMDEMGMWSRVLNSSEITALYNSGNGVTYSPRSNPSWQINITSPVNGSTYTNYVTSLNYSILNASVGYTSCYQESANTTNQSGIDGSCGLNYTGKYSGSFTFNWEDNLYPGNNSIDGNWNTYDNTNTQDGPVYNYINYTIPSPTPTSATWQVKDGVGIVNYTIPAQCFRTDGKVRIQLSLGGFPSLQNYDCINDSGGGYNFATGRYSGSKFYEDAIIWSKSGASVSCKYSLNGGVLNITSNCSNSYSGTLITGLLARYGLNLWTVFAEEVGYLAQTAYASFDMFTPAPVINITSPLNGSVINAISNTAAVFNVAVNESVNLSSTWYTPVSQNPLWSGLLSYWGFNGNINDSLGIYNLTGTQNFVSGINGNAQSYNGSFYNPVFGGTLPQLLSAGNFTISLWIKTSDACSGGVCSLIDYGSWGQSPGRWWLTMNSNGGTGKLVFASSPPWPPVDAITVNDGNWKHIVITRRGTGVGNLKYYVNGVNTYNSSQDYSDYAIYNYSSSTFGAQTQGVGSPRPYTGLMDEVGFWSRSLSDQEILYLYNNNATYTSSSLNQNITCGARSGNTYPCSAQITPVQGYNFLTIFANDSVGAIGNSSLSFFYDSIAPTINVTSPPAVINPNGSMVNFTASIVDNNYSLSVYNGLRAYWNFESIGSTITDILTGTYNLTAYNSPAAVNGVVGNALNVSSSQNQYAQSPSPFNLELSNNNFAFNLWIYYIGGPGVNPFMFKNASICGIEMDAASNWELYVGNCAGGYYSTITSPVTPNAWTMITVTANSTGTNFYKNGVYIGTTSLTPNMPTNGDFLLSKDRAGGTGYINGKFDEYGIWNRSLNESEILTLYNSGLGATYNGISTASGIKNVTLDIRGTTTNGTSYSNTTILTYAQDVFTTVVSIPVSLADGFYSWFMRVFDWAGNQAVTNSTIANTYAPQNSSKIESWETGANTYFLATPSRKGGQTFTAGYTTPGNWTLKSFGVNILRVGTPGTITVSLYATSGGLPTGSPLVQNTTVNADNFDTSYRWENITLPDYTLVSGTKYAVVFEYLSSAELRWQTRDTTPSYSGGDCIDNLGSWATCGPNPNEDIYFQIWATPIIVAPYNLNVDSTNPQLSYGAGTTWFNTNYNKKKLISYTSASTQTNFVMPVYLNSSNFNFADSINGSDIMFVNSADNAELISFLEYYNATQQKATYWIVTNVSAGANSFYAYYNSTQVAARNNTIFGYQNAAFALPLGENTGTTLFDRSSNNKNFTRGATTNWVNGNLLLSNISEAGNILTSQSNVVTTANKTVVIRANFTKMFGGSGNLNAAFGLFQLAAGAGGWETYLYNAGGGKFSIYHFRTSGGVSDYWVEFPNSYLNDGQFHTVIVSWYGVSIPAVPTTAYFNITIDGRNGSSISSSGGTGGVYSATNAPAYVGYTAQWAGDIAYNMTVDFIGTYSAKDSGWEKLMSDSLQDNMLTFGSSTTYAGYTNPSSGSNISVNNVAVTVSLTDQNANFSTSGWWNSSFSSRKEITLSPATSVVNQSVLVTIPYSSAMKTNFGDLRFVTTSGQELGYWFYNNTCTTGVSCQVWVMIPSSGTSSIYTYYGNSGVNTTSNISNAFIFADDFNGASVDWTNKWQSSNQGIYSVSNGLLNNSGTNGGNDAISSRNSYSNTITEARVMVTTSSWAFYVIPTDASPTVYTGTNQIELNHVSGASRIWFDGTPNAGDSVANTWYRMSMGFPPTGPVFGNRTDDNSQQLQYATGTTSRTSGYIKMWQYYVGSFTYTDWIYTRPYVASEPTVSLSGEEINSGNVLFNLDGTISRVPISSCTITNITWPLLPTYSCTQSYSGLSQGLHSYSASFTDLLGLTNSTETRTFFVDTISPTVTDLIPMNNTYMSSTTVSPFNMSLVTQCYQETANVSTTCGGVNTGSYWFSSTCFDPPNNYLYDGDWSTVVGTCNPSSPNSQFNINYTKPYGAIGALWQAKTGTTPITRNVTISSSCFAKSGNLELYLTAGSNGNLNNAFKCINSTGAEETLGIFATDGSGVFEEAIIWIFNNTYYGGNVTFNASASDIGSGINTATLNITGTNAAGQAVSNETTITIGSLTQTVVSIPVALMDGVYRWFIRVVDMAGNIGTSQTNNLYLDSVSPVVNITYPSSGITNRNVTNVTFTVYDGTFADKVWFTSNGGVTNTSLFTCNATYNCTLGTTFVYRINATEGTNTWTVYANDTVGNLGSSTVSFLLDRLAPTITDRTPINNSFINPGNSTCFAAHYVKQINITSTDSVASNNVSVLLNISYESQMQSDFSDLYFYDDQNRSVGFWFYNNTCINGVSCQVWVKPNSLIGGGNNATIFMEYGGPSTYGSNISAAFMLGDDFTGTSIAWGTRFNSTSMASFSQSGDGWLNQSVTSNDAGLRFTNLYSNYIWESRLQYTTAGSAIGQNAQIVPGITWVNSNALHCVSNTCYMYINPVQTSAGDVGTNPFRYYASLNGTYLKLNASLDNGVQQHYLEGTPSNIASENITNSRILTYRENSGITRWDWMYLRRFVNVEPTYTIDANSTAHTYCGGNVTFNATIRDLGTQPSINNGLLAYWTMNETTGSVVDSLGLNNGTNNGATRGTPGIINNSFGFDGATSYVEAPAVVPLGAAPKTVSLWFYHNTSQLGVGKMMFSQGNSAVDQANFGLGINEANSFYFYGYNFGDFTCGGTAQDNTWTHFAIAYNGTHVICYVNGTYVNAGARALDTQSTNISIGTGSSVFSAFRFSGYVDEIGVWNRSLNSSEMLYIYNSGSGRTYSSYSTTSGIKNVTLTINGNLYDGEPITYTNTTNFSIGTVFTTVMSIPVVLTDGVYTWFTSAWDWAGNNIISPIFGLTIDTVSPELTIDYPLDGGQYNYFVTNMTFTVTHGGQATPTNIWFTNDSGVTNYTILSNTNFTGTMTVLNLTSSNGANTWELWINNTVGHTNYHVHTFYVDTVFPTVYYTGATPQNGTYRNASTIPFAINAYDLNLKNITSRLYNSTGLFASSTNSTVVPSNVTWTSSFTGVDDTYWINSTACDTFANCNGSETRQFIVDLISPVLTFVNATTSTGGVTTSLWANVSINEKNIQDIVISLNQIPPIYTNSTTFNNRSLFTTNPYYVFMNWTNLDEGDYNCIATVRDMVNHTTTIFRTISIDGTPPNVSFVAPTPIAVSVFNYIPVNVTADDIHYANMTIYLTNSSGSVINTTFTTSANKYLQYNVVDGDYVINATAFDTLNNQGWTENRAIHKEFQGAGISLCRGSISLPGQYYMTANITANITEGGACLSFDVADIYLDCRGHSITLNINSTAIAMTKANNYLTNCRIVVPSGGTGIRITNNSAATISNSFIDGFYGVYLENSFATITNSTIANNVYGLFVTGRATLNVINETSFINSTGYRLAASNTWNFRDVNVTAAYNTSSALIAPGNYTLSANQSTITNATSVNWNNVRLSYSYAYDVPDTKATLTDVLFSSNTYGIYHNYTANFPGGSSGWQVWGPSGAGAYTRISFTGGSNPITLVGSSYNVFNGINSATGNVLYSTRSSNNAMTNGNFVGATVTLTGNSITNTFHDTNYSSESVDSTSSLTRSWTSVVRVIDRARDPVRGGTVHYTDSSGNNHTVTTDQSGNAIDTITDYENIYGNVTGKNPYDLIASFQNLGGSGANANITAPYNTTLTINNDVTSTALSRTAMRILLGIILLIGLAASTGFFVVKMRNGDSVVDIWKYFIIMIIWDVIFLVLFLVLSKYVMAFIYPNVPN